MKHNNSLVVGFSLVFLSACVGPNSGDTTSVNDEPNTIEQSVQETLDAIIVEKTVEAELKKLEPSKTPIPIPSPTETFTPQPTDTPSPQPTNTSTPQPTNTFTPEPTATPSPLPISTPMTQPINTLVPQPKNTPIPETNSENEQSVFAINSPGNGQWFRLDEPVIFRWSDGVSPVDINLHYSGDSSTCSNNEITFLGILDTSYTLNSSELNGACYGEWQVEINSATAQAVIRINYDPTSGSSNNTPSNPNQPATPTPALSYP